MNDNIPVIPMKVGDNADFDCVYTTELGAAIPLAGYSIGMKFRDPSTRRVLAEATVGNGVTITDSNNGEFSIEGGSTDGWPEGQMRVDIRYTLAGKTQTTETFILDFEESYS